MWKGTLFKRRTPQCYRINCSESFNGVTATANYKFSEKIKYLKLLRSNSGVQETHFLKHRLGYLRNLATCRISMRKYALTSTAYKFLDIGIVVRSTFHVQIAIGDNQGNHMFIPHARGMNM
ncbi:PREDICTED: uncharacterized protein LOC108692310 [Atta colombica]|uniref:uncharacterized protein LOC108692310 n=1 Tax=Atta colombica TaxID=520822 RepID=UPI00084CD02F|nr:PREDICTED: uncharacterized protein LOC108692310 [Atta colombica]